MNNPKSSDDILKKRSEILHETRQFFYNRDFIEVETPSLVVSPGFEPTLQAFRTKYFGMDRAIAKKMFLPTSPEFHMKKLLARGYEKIFQICRAYRNGEIGRYHNPEFTILEWYRANENYDSVMSDTENLISQVAENVSGTPLITTADNLKIDLSPPWNRMTVNEAWKTYCDIDLDAATSAKELLAAGRKLGVQNLSLDDDWEILYFKIFLSTIEPHLGFPKPTILMEYPSVMAALARLKPEDPSVSLRFEIYIAGIELANAFDELTDIREQRQRFMQAQLAQKAMKTTIFPIDESLFKAMSEYFPKKAAGIALGIDRMIMLLTGRSSINDVIAFPFDTSQDEENRSL
ncbi:EF-P lysine aminoacylase GenX [bacterium]|nr:EF-P lysine aminoacylase GenX [candidate division CSSED10-310 bacterium]